MDTVETLETTSQDELDLLILETYPRQGEWSVEAYLDLTDDSRRLLEYVDGRIEVLPMPTDSHQAILAYLYDLFLAIVKPLGGKVRFSPLRMRVGPRRFREPDLLLVLAAGDPRRQNRFWEGADLVLEVVSPQGTRRDTVTKRQDYAAAGIAEYWIVDPQAATITVLTLNEGSYAEHGSFARGAQATSALLPAFSADVTGVLDAE